MLLPHLFPSIPAFFGKSCCFVRAPSPQLLRTGQKRIEPPPSSFSFFSSSSKSGSFVAVRTEEEEEKSQCPSDEFFASPFPSSWGRGAGAALPSDVIFCSFFPDPSPSSFRKLARLSLAREGGKENGRNVCVVVVINVIQGTTTIFLEKKFCEVGLGS